MMFVFLCKRLDLNRSSISLLNSKTQLGAFSFEAFFSIRCISSSPNSFTVSYLINQLGFSQRAAISASKRVKFQTPEKPDYARSFFRDNGFNDSEISITFRKKPELLLANHNKTILPKIQFLLSVGVTREVLPKIITRNPIFLAQSLKKNLVPCYDILRSVLSDDKVVQAMIRLSPIGLSLAKNNLAANISNLRALGVPESTISYMLYNSPSDLCHRMDKFNGAIKKIIEMGFDPARYTFAYAVQMQLRMSPKTWEAKLDVFKRWGLSEDQFWSAFRKNQLWLRLSGKMIMKKMDVIVNKMGWQPDDVARDPYVLAYSLEKRIVPRCSVMRILLLKGLIKKEIRLISILAISEKRFFESFVSKHLEKEPLLLDVLKGIRHLKELGLEFKENRSEEFYKECLTGS